MKKQCLCCQLHLPPRYTVFVCVLLPLLVLVTNLTDYLFAHRIVFYKQREIYHCQDNINQKNKYTKQDASI